MSKIIRILALFILALLLGCTNRYYYNPYHGYHHHVPYYAHSNWKATHRYHYDRQYQHRIHGAKAHKRPNYISY